MQPASRIEKLARGSMRTLLLLAILGSAACGGEPFQLDNRATALLETAPTGSAALAEQDLPGCRGQELPRVVHLVRYPDAIDLLVVLVEGKAFCVDTPAVVLHSLGQTTEEGTGLPGDDPVPVRGSEAPGEEGDDDPVPIKGGSTAEGDDDPVPIKGGGTGGGSNVGDGDDDPVPINGKHIAPPSPVQVTAARGNDDSGMPSHPLDPRLLAASRAR